MNLRLSYILSFCLLFILIIIPFMVEAAIVKLAWDPNTEKDLAGYKVYYGYSSRNYHTSIDVGNTTSVQIVGLKDGQTYYFAVTAYNTSGLESDYSNEVSYKVPKTNLDEDRRIDDDKIHTYKTSPCNPATGEGRISDEGEVKSLELACNENSDNNDPNLRPLFPCMEIGEVGVDHNWRRVKFNNYFVDPVVVAKPLSYNEEDPATLRIRNVDNTGFDIRIQEWDYLDGAHIVEKVGYMVMERGGYTLEDGTKVEAGRFFTDKKGSSYHVNFSQVFNQVPVVVATVSSFNEEDAVCCKLRNIDTKGFDFCMQGLDDSVHLVEIISYIAWEPSMGITDNIIFEVNRSKDITNYGFCTIPFNQVFVNVPVFIADIQTGSSMNAATLRWQMKDIYGVDVWVDEGQKGDSEINAVLGYMAFSKP